MKGDGIERAKIRMVDGLWTATLGIDSAVGESPAIAYWRLRGFRIVRNLEMQRRAQYQDVPQRFAYLAYNAL